MKTGDTRPRPGAMAATMAFLSRPDKTGALRLKHELTCAAHRGRPCDCCACLERRELKQ